MPIVSPGPRAVQPEKTEIVAVNPRKALGITTSLANAETLMAQGYNFRRHVSGGRTLVVVEGKPTVHRNRLTKELYLQPHGPYTVDVEAGTCPCAGFQHHDGVCKHAAAARVFDEFWREGQSVPVIREALEAMSALKEIDGERYHVQDRRVVVFRNYARAGAYWQEHGLIEHCELHTLTSAGRAAIQGAGKYVGLRLVTASGHKDIDFVGVATPLGGR